MLNEDLRHSTSRCYFFWQSESNSSNRMYTSGMLFYFYLNNSINVHNHWALSSSMQHDAASRLFPRGALWSLPIKHPPAAGNLLLVLNVTSTYDWSDPNFILCCTVALNQDRAGWDYILGRVFIFRYGTNCFVLAAILSII